MTYTAGIIGLSWVGEHHRDAYLATADIDVVAIADVDTEALAEKGDAWEIPEEHRYTNHQELLSAHDLDVVSVATPTFLHRDHVVAAATTGEAPDVIWVEKPIAGSVREADEMLKECENADVDLVVNHTRRFGESYQRLKQLVADGHLGRIRSVHITGPEELLRNGTHYIDLINYLLDEEFTWGYGYLTNSSEQMGPEFDDSGGAGMLRTETGTYVHVDCTVPRGMNLGKLHLVGDEGALTVDFWQEDCRYWALQTDPAAPYGQRHVEADLPVPIGEFDELPEMFDRAADHVVELLEGTATNQSPGGDASNVLESIVALFIANYTGSDVTMPLERPLRECTIRSL